ncbi:oxidoreductase [Jatrophihabitans sp. GAS493]|uniref:oxidoreductase n=1 Tax=Jatrophihabitans sp. GAS493 TaxID=1907575 RepID=UPI001F531904|nr:oxidoreductase [Jatrophihabitans sp. GAS493]
MQLPDLTGKSAVVTGANSGIGYVTARELAAHGARVVLACRDVERGKQAADKIGSAHNGADLEVRALDLSKIASVRDFAASQSDPVDLLINNAGVMAPPKLRSTADGFELQFGTNHLGHFVLTGLLLPHLLEAPAARVVTVSSVAHFGGGPDVIDGNAGPGYSPQKAYSNSKLANLLFALELQRRAEARSLPLSSTAAHPGVAATGLVTDPQGLGANALVRAVAPIVLRIFTQSSAAGANPSLFAATEAAPGTYTGPQWMREWRGPIGPARMTNRDRDPELARRLWEVSEDLTGLRYPWPS